MDVMELGAIGEMVGGVAVIASLVYVGFQLRQSTHAQNAATIESHLHTLVTMNNLIAGDSELARIMSEGVIDRSGLDRAEYFRFHLTLRGVFFAFDAFRIKREDNMVNDSLWFSNQSILAGMMQMPRVVHW
jgi:hypothetical protein